MRNKFEVNPLVKIMIFGLCYKNKITEIGEIISVIYSNEQEILIQETNKLIESGYFGKYTKKKIRLTEAKLCQRKKR